MTEQELDRLAGSRLQLEMQVNTLESANLNATTMAAMKKASDALKVIHGNLCVIPFIFPNEDAYLSSGTRWRENITFSSLWDHRSNLTLRTFALRLTVNTYHRTIDKVDATMNAMNEQRELATEIADSLANPLNAGIDLDEVRVSCPVRLLCLVLINSALSSLSIPARNYIAGCEHRRHSDCHTSRHTIPSMC